MKPRINVKAFAELVKLPAAKQIKKLHEQKYPKEIPNSFKAPYYSPSISTIRSYFKSNNDSSALEKGIIKLQQFSQEHKKRNNLRVINQFSNSDYSNRKISIGPNEKYEYSANGVDVRVSFELCGNENDSLVRSLYHFPKKPIDENAAKLTLEFTSWLLTASDVTHSLKELEYIDIPGGKTYSIKRIRKSSIALLEDNITIIKTLWPEI